jgi:CheY-like chemotaxis protein
MARLDIEDSGIGIEPAFLPQVFDRFRQADSSSTRHAGGLGLGLALVRHIVHAHGGEIAAHSDGLGQGACFTVLLPLGSRRTPLPPQGSSAPELTQAAHESGPMAQRTQTADPMLTCFGPLPLHGMHLLVVEDHEDTRDLITEFLSAQGARVHPAANGDEALQQLRAMPRDARTFVVCDIGLPGESGHEVLARLRRQEDAQCRPADHRLVAIALSAFTREEDRLRSLAAGFLAHLGKPVSHSELLGQLVALRSATMTATGA